jgi:membrane protein DedA with SNARE-associated domain
LKPSGNKPAAISLAGASEKDLQETLEILARHGYWVLFLNVLMEQIGIPVPAVPVLLGMGALAGMHRFSFGKGLLVAVIACLLSDSVWYMLGRIKGQSVLKTLCRISLEPESCVSLTRGWFERLGSSALLFAKFVPGFSTAAQPMAGVNGISPARFVLLDGAGSALWAGTFLGIGYMFHGQAAAIWTALTRLGSGLAVLIAAVLALYLIVKYWQRTIYIRALRGNRIAPSELRERLESEEPPILLDLRRAGEVRSIGHTLPTARWVDVARLKLNQLDIGQVPEGRDIVLFCS